MDSPVAHLLHTNQIPSDEEVQQIQPVITKGDNDISDLDAEISRVRAIADDLLKQREKIQEVVDAHRALLSPIRRLPGDIIEEIFLRCLPEGRGSGISRLEAPFLLTLVCQGWRAFALSIPRLWSSIYISTVRAIPSWKSRTASVYWPTTENLSAWLDRSRQLPLSISFTNTGDTENYASSLLALLIQHSHRWKVIDLNLTPALSNSLLTIPPDAVPLLEKITIDIQRHWDRPRLVWDEMNFLQTAPRLRNAGFMGWGRGRQVLPWIQLTHLITISVTHTDHDLGLTDVEALEMLRLCCNLLHCSLNLVPSPSMPITIDQTIELASLESLHLHAFSDFHLRLFLTRVNVPNVRDVQICTSGADMGPWPQEEVTSLLSRASSSIKKLAIYETGISTEEVIQCLRLLPALVGFSFRDPGPVTLNAERRSVITNEVLELLSPESSGPSTFEDSPGLILALEALDVKLRDPISDKALQRFIQSRRCGTEGVSRLQAAYFHFDRRAGNGPWSYPEAPDRFPLPDTNWEFATLLREEGMHLSIVYEGYDVVSGSDANMYPPMMSNQGALDEQH